MKTRPCDHCRKKVFLSSASSEIPGYELFDPAPIRGWQRVFDDTDNVRMVPAVVYTAHGCEGHLRHRAAMREKWLLVAASGIQADREQRERDRRRNFARRASIAQDISEIAGNDDGWATLPTVEDVAYEIACDKCEADKDDACWNLAATRNKRTTAHPHPERIYAALAARKIAIYLHTDGRVRLYPVSDTSPEPTDVDSEAAT